MSADNYNKETDIEKQYDELDSISDTPMVTLMKKKTIKTISESKTGKGGKTTKRKT